MRKLKLSVQAVCDQGKIKEKNEDSIMVKIGEDEFGEFGLFIVADGMGGLKYGEVASRMVVEGFKRWWHGSLVDLIAHDQINIKAIKKSIESCVYEINLEIIQLGKLTKEKLGTTLTLFFVYRNQFYIHHIGDSRVYNLTMGKLKQLTIDHSWVSIALASGSLTLSEAINHPKRNLLTQCIGIYEELKPDQKLGKLKGNEIFLICSDGFYKYLPENAIAKILSKNHENLVEAIEEVVEQIYQNGARDNLSAIVIKLGESYQPYGVINFLMNR